MSDQKLQEIITSLSPILPTEKASEQCPAWVRNYQRMHIIEQQKGRLRKERWENKEKKWWAEDKGEKKKSNCEEGSQNKDRRNLQCSVCTHQLLIPVLEALLSYGQTLLFAEHNMKVLPHSTHPKTLFHPLSKQRLENHWFCLAELKEQVPPTDKTPVCFKNTL